MQTFLLWLVSSKLNHNTIDTQKFLHWCYWMILQQEPVGFMQKEISKPTICGKVWQAGALAYRCVNCQQNESR